MSYIKTVRENVTMYNTNGLGYCELQDLLAVLIGNSATPELTGKLAAIGIIELGKMSVKELQNEGLSQIKALEIHSAFMLARKYLSLKESTVVNTITSVEDAVKCLYDISFSDQEHFSVIFLNARHEVLSKKVLFTGSFNEVQVYPGEIFREAFKVSATGMILAHCHVSSDCSPSKHDLDITYSINKAAKLVGLEVIDHVIVSGTKHLSLKECGYF